MSLFTEAVEILSKLYGLQQEETQQKLTELGHKFNLKKEGNLDEGSAIWSQITVALANRNNNTPAAIAAMDAVLKHPRMVTELTGKMQNLKGKFIALFAANKIEAASYHFYGHGEKMSQDPGAFLAFLLPKGSTLNPFMQVITNALGAAHDIIQQYSPPANEKASAEIFRIEAQKMITQLLNQHATDWTKDELKALEEFRDKTIPFLAEECIVNSTYLLFNSGKRDFDNVLTQVYRTLNPHHGADLDPLTAGMKMAIALSDTRRSEMKNILRKMELLRSVPASQLPSLEKLLQGIKLLDADITITQLIEQGNEEKLMQIEGYLLRIGQNIRIVAELRVAFAPAAEKENRKDMLKLIVDLRTNKKPAVSIENCFELFLKCIPGPFGEIAFAGALGEIDRNELRDHAHFYNLSLNEDTIDLLGWTRHAEDLGKTKNFLDFTNLTAKEKQSIAEMLFTVAAKPPEHRVCKETYEAMKSLTAELTQHPQLLENLQTEMKEILCANPHLEDEAIHTVSEAMVASGSGLNQKSITEQLQEAVNRAQQNYAEHYQDNSIKARGQNGWFSWFHHGEEGQKNARQFKALCSTSNDIYSDLEKLLSSPNTRYNRHSFASYLLDELSTVLENNNKDGLKKTNGIYEPLESLQTLESGLSDLIEAKSLGSTH